MALTSYAKVALEAKAEIRNEPKKSVPRGSFGLIPNR